MSRYIRIEDAIEAAINGCASWDGGYFPSMDDPIKAEFDAIGDKCIDVVRCRECKSGIMYELLNEKYCKGEFHSLDYFCADGERKDDETDR